MSDPQLI